MALFAITELNLVALWERSQYPIPNKGDMVIFGMRGIRPTDFGGTDTESSHNVVYLEEDYKTMRCSLGVWIVGTGFALFPGSTVPYGVSVENRVANNGVGVNQIGKGRYKKYIKGDHASGAFPNGHRALLQRCNIIVQRTGDDNDYDGDDRWEQGLAAIGFSHVGDNIHCARNMGSDSAGIPNTKYSSLGCSVVAGTVLPNASGVIQERGPWAKFIDLVYDSPQDSFEYVVWGGNEVLSMCASNSSGKTALLRFGSHGSHVKRLQRRLTELGSYSAGIDGDFGYNSFAAVRSTQKQHGIEPDGVVGPETAGAIGFELPMASSGGSAPSNTPDDEIVIDTSPPSEISGFFINTTTFGKFAPRPSSGVRRSRYDDYLRAFTSEEGRAVLNKYGISDNYQRLCHFYAQAAHETGNFCIVRESLNYKTVKRIREVWPSRTNHLSDSWIKANLVGNEVAIGDFSYGDRMGNKKGTRDGYDFRGGGMFQTTGRYSYEKYGDLLGIPLGENPDLIEDPIISLKTAALEWDRFGGNELADLDEVKKISRALNRGNANHSKPAIGEKQRIEILKKIKQYVLSTS